MGRANLERKMAHRRALILSSYTAPIERPGRAPRGSQPIGSPGGSWSRPDTLASPEILKNFYLQLCDNRV